MQILRRAYYNGFIVGILLGFILITGCSSSVTGNITIEDFQGNNLEGEVRKIMYKNAALHLLFTTPSGRQDSLSVKGLPVSLVKEAYLKKVKTVKAVKRHSPTGPSVKLYLYGQSGELLAVVADRMSLSSTVIAAWRIFPGAVGAEQTGDGRVLAQAVVSGDSKKRKVSSGDWTDLEAQGEQWRFLLLHADVSMDYAQTHTQFGESMSMAGDEAAGRQSEYQTTDKESTAIAAEEPAFLADWLLIRK